jgi:hypothetical protein
LKGSSGLVLQPNPRSCTSLAGLRIELLRNSSGPTFGLLSARQLGSTRPRVSHSRPAQPRHYHWPLKPPTNSLIPWLPKLPSTCSHEVLINPSPSVRRSPSQPSADNHPQERASPFYFWRVMRLSSSLALVAFVSSLSEAISISEVSVSSPFEYRI